MSSPQGHANTPMGTFHFPLDSPHGGIIFPIPVLGRSEFNFIARLPVYRRDLKDTLWRYFTGKLDV